MRICAALVLWWFAWFAHGEDGAQEVALYLEGRSLFQNNCVVCHGTTGRGNGPWAEEMTIKPRNFRTGLFKFRSSPYGMLPIEQDLVRTIRAGISGTAMPAFSQLRDDELTSLIAYLRQLSHSWRDPTLVAAPLPLPDPPIWFTSPTEARGHRQHGGELFAALCVPCHGPAGKGDGPVSLNLFDAWGRPIRPADLTAAHHKSGDSPRDLYRSIATGLNGTPMPGFAPTLGVEEIWDLVSFLTSGR